ncbi:MAG: UPF0280 family protein [Alphaproteobacteria bacterium]|nr:UPF0280 family protein [Alphaproteobacteria bacterium]
MRAGLLPDGKRLHLQHGPIDLIVEAFGDPAEVHAAYVQAAAGFVDVLPTLVKELPLLRMPLGDACPLPAGPVAQRMVAACWPHRSTFITPMAAVAGSVADHMLQALLDGRRLDRAYVNDGGDIAFHLAPAQSLTCGLVADLAALAVDGTISLSHALPVRGLATSGRATKGQGGRSFSLGIADSVTVLARDAAAADAAATMITNAVDLPGHPAIAREPASAQDPDSDLGDRLVTLDVGALSDEDVAEALRSGAAKAEDLRRSGLIHGAVLVLKRRLAAVGADLPLLAAA